MSVTTLCGSNSYEIGQELDKRLKRFLATKNNDASGIERIDAALIDDPNLGELINRLSSPSLFAVHKLVIIRDLSKNTEFSQLFIDWLDGADEDDDSSEIIILDPSLDGRSKLYKELKSKTDFKELRLLKEPLLSEWVIKYMRFKGGTIDRATASYLVDKVGPDQQRLASEIDKLMIYDPLISKASIDLLVEPSIDSTTFDLADAVFSRNRSKALRLYLEQRQRRVEPILIIGSLAWQLHLLLLVKSAEEELSVDQIARDSGINSWSISKARQLASAINSNDLVSAIDKLMTIDNKSKSARGYSSDDALQYYLLSI